jgi:hypothetical protein
MQFHVKVKKEFLKMAKEKKEKNRKKKSLLKMIIALKLFILLHQLKYRQCWRRQLTLQKKKNLDSRGLLQQLKIIHLR